MNEEFLMCQGAEYVLTILYSVLIDGSEPIDLRIEKKSFDWKYVSPVWLDKLIYFNTEEKLTEIAFSKWKHNENKTKIKEIKIEIK